MVVRVKLILGLSLPSDFIIFLLYIYTFFSSVRIWKMEIYNEPSCAYINLEPLLLKLPDFCLQSKAVNTRRSYEGAFNKWCVPYNISTLPASDVNVSLYLMHLSKFKKSSSTINEAFYAISWAHNIAGVVDPCNSTWVGVFCKRRHFESRWSLSIRWKPTPWSDLQVAHETTQSTPLDIYLWS